MAETQSKEMILKAAAELFKEKGFANVSVREICSAAGVSLPMIYYYFKDKRGLFQAVSRQHITLKPLLTDLALIQWSKQTSTKKLATFIKIYLTSFPSDLLNAGLYMREKTDFDRASIRRFAGDLDQAHALMTAVICDGMATREFKETDAHRAADCVLGMMHRAISQQAHFHREYDPAETAAYITKFSLAALRKMA